MDCDGQHEPVPGAGVAVLGLPDGDDRAAIEGDEAREGLVGIVQAMASPSKREQGTASPRSPVSMISSG